MAVDGDARYVTYGLLICNRN